MNRAARARELLLKNLGKRVTIRMMEDAGIWGYTCRNAVAECRPILEKEGYQIIHEYHGPNEGVWDNGWVCKPVDVQMKLAI